ncbi:MAG: hypothetical protein KDM91_16970 [Verrucomicrobiae bacterium]|nr:hypothetical protein [Verrucomicrobiae bacterium]
MVRELARARIEVPEPSRVEVSAGEDFEGDPVFRLVVYFASSVPPETIPWKKISPLIAKLHQLAFERGGFEVPVLTEVRRLGESLSGASS